MHRKRIIIAGFDLSEEIRMRTISRAMRDAGFEIIYGGSGNTVDNIINAAIQEDVDAIGIGLYLGYNKEKISNLMKRLEEKELSDIVVFLDGIIPTKDFKYLKRRSIDRIFTQETNISDIVNYAKTIERKEKTSFFKKIYEIFLSLE